MVATALGPKSCAKVGVRGRAAPKRSVTAQSSAQEGSYSIRTLRDAAERQVAFEWARQEGWWPGLGDEAVGAALDPSGWFGGFMCASASNNDDAAADKTSTSVPDDAEGDEEMVTVICGLKLTPRLGFVGLYICAPEYRGMGLAKPLFDHAMAYLQEDAARNVALDGVEAQVSNYAKSGFKPAFKAWRCTGPARALAGLRAPDTVATCTVHPVDFKDENTLTRIAEFDFREASGHERRRYFAARVATKGCRAAICTDRDGDIRGFVAVRPALAADGSVVAMRVGPLLALDVADALRLAAWVGEQSDGEQTVSIDIMESSEAFLRHVIEAGFEQLWGCVRMYTDGEPEEMRLDRIFAISSWEMQIA